MMQYHFERVARFAAANGVTIEPTAAGVSHYLDGLAGCSDADLWALAAAVAGRIPTELRFGMLSRDRTLLGIEPALARWVVDTVEDDDPARTVELVVDRVVVDVHDTSRTTKTTGIQRVVRETVRRWNSEHEVVLVAWTEDGTALRPLLDWERASLLGLDGPHEGDDPDQDDLHVIIPVRGTYIAAELFAEEWRAAAVGSIARYSGSDVGVIGYDAVPLTSSETSAEGIASHFPLYLQAIAGATRLAAISEAAATEFVGWRRMLRGAGTAGPDIRTVQLAAEIRQPTPAEVADARAQLDIRGGEPLVLVVGSHEPRKNHLAVLQAARIAWSRGVRFRLVFIGGMSWGNPRFHREIEQLRDVEKRPVRVVSKASDGLLAAAYTLASVTLFPSLHEGFGLPVAESLTLGTPVITSGYGSMLEIAEEGGGALLIDPRNDEDIANAIERIVADDAFRASLEAEAGRRTVRTWDAYSAELWGVFVEE